MKRGKPTWRSKAGPKLMARVDDAIRSLKGNAPEIWRRHNLQRYCALATFKLYCAAQRRATRAQSEPSPPAPPSEPSSLKDQLKEAIQYAMDQLHADAIPPYALGALLQALSRARVVEFQEDASKRAQEIHESKMKRLKAELKARAKANPNAKYSPAEITQLIADVMSGKVGA